VKDSNLFSIRLRCVAVAAGIASALALFPIWFLLQPALLIAGGVIQPRHPSAGRWLVWIGAVNLAIITLMYDVMLFQHPRLHPDYMTVAFSVSTILLLWCYVELVVDGIKRLRARGSTPPPVPRPVSRGIWVLALVLSLLVVLRSVGWFVGWVFAPAKSGYFHSGPFYPLVMFLVNAGIVVAFDISLTREAARFKREGLEPDFSSRLTCRKSRSSSPGGI
jgi:hypothetical protein